MPGSSLYVLSNPRRGRRHNLDVAAYNPDFAVNPEYNPRRGKRRRNPSTTVAKLQRTLFQGASLTDAGTVAFSLVATSKLTSAIKGAIMPPPAAAGLLPTTAPDILVEPLISAGLAVGMGFAGKQLVNESVGQALALGGLATAILNTVKYIPGLQTFVAPGSLVLGASRPRALPPQVQLAALPAASLGSRPRQMADAIIRGAI